MKTECLYAMNRKQNKAEQMKGFICWEHLQGAFRCGIMLSDGSTADAIGRVRSAAEFHKRAKAGKTSIITPPCNSKAKGAA